MTRALSALETRLILKLEWDRKVLITIPEAKAVLGTTYGHTRLVLHRLARDGWLARLGAGKYELIPAERGEFAFADPNPLLAGSALATPYYFSYSTAAYHYGLTTQAPAVVYIAALSGKTQRRVIRDHEYQLIRQPKLHFFGAVAVEAFGLRVQMADVEKTVLDSLDRPNYAGGLPEVAGMLARGRSQLNWDKLVADALRFESPALVQRLGHLCDVLAVPWSAAAREQLRAQVGRGKFYLGQTGRWGTGGRYDAAWQVVDNIPPSELKADLEIR